MSRPPQCNRSTIHKRILRSNAIMVFCSLITLFTVNGIIFQHFRGAGAGAEVLKRVREHAGTEMPFINFMVVSVLSIMTILFLSLLFTRLLAKRIMAPVNLLVSAAHRVESGNLSEKIRYAGDDEFETLCSAFNQMQSHLLAEREKNAAYETARTGMIAGISHDLRTPLTSVKGFIRGMMDGVADTPEKQKQYLSIAYKKACDMDALINKLFFFSKIETGNLPIVLVDTDWAEYAARFARDSEEDWGVSVGLYADGRPYPVRIDPDNMKRVLNNLVDNALKYADTQPVQITMRLSREAQCAALCFSDNGKGVPEEKLPCIFDQFYRADEARGSQKNEGSGLGLYVVKYIVEALGGSVQAHNENGLTIIIRLPWREGV